MRWSAFNASIAPPLRDWAPLPLPLLLPLAFALGVMLGDFFGSLPFAADPAATAIAWAGFDVAEPACWAAAFSSPPFVAVLADCLAASLLVSPGLLPPEELSDWDPFGGDMVLPPVALPTVRSAAVQGGNRVSGVMLHAFNAGWQASANCLQRASGRQSRTINASSRTEKKPIWINILIEIVAHKQGGWTGRD
ncbi:hypothetical protein [Novosphingobium sp. B1]|uniref:hypothetical protein n=1 Tax=Novosphingobium sp. B1 TaxID=1938756 RepID=UPI001593D14E|nr:hypothetical protein [Novosphingobium sp. B1]